VASLEDTQQCWSCRSVHQERRILLFGIARPEVPLLRQEFPFGWHLEDSDRGRSRDGGRFIAVRLVQFWRYGAGYLFLSCNAAFYRISELPQRKNQDSLYKCWIGYRARHFARWALSPIHARKGWGKRSDVGGKLSLTRCCTRSRDSQPLTGVPADRHLTQSAPVAADFTRANREELARSRPAFIMDGLSLYNPALAIDRYPELGSWLARYREVARTRTIVIYRLIEPAATVPSSRPRVSRGTPRCLPARRPRASSWS
jgi:hypothetical protein